MGRREGIFPLPIIHRALKFLIIAFFFLSKYPTEASSEERVAEVTLQEVKDDLNMILFVI